MPFRWIFEICWRRFRRFSAAFRRADFAQLMSKKTARTDRNMQLPQAPPEALQGSLVRAFGLDSIFRLPFRAPHPPCTFLVNRPSSLTPWVHLLRLVSAVYGSPLLSPCLLKARLWRALSSRDSLAANTITLPIIIMVLFIELPRMVVFILTLSGIFRFIFLISVGKQFSYMHALGPWAFGVLVLSPPLDPFPKSIQCPFSGIFDA